MPEQKPHVPAIRAKIERLTDYPDCKIKAVASVTVGGAFAIHGIRVIDSQKGLFVQMPQSSYQRGGKTEYTDIVHPVSAQARKELSDAVLEAYAQELAQAQDETDDFGDKSALPFTQTM